MSNLVEKAESFLAYCKKNPNKRFWQALRNWSSYNFIFVGDTSDKNEAKDTYYFED